VNAETPGVDITVTMAAYNEAACIVSTLRELAGVLATLNRTFEVLVVDDGSTDETHLLLAELRGEIAALRIIRLTPNSGQSAALGTGFRRARGRIVVTMDADGQDDPANIPRLLAEIDAGFDCCCGYRANRRDRWSKRAGSRIANWVRNRALGENIIDTGCPLKAFRAELGKDLMIWNGMHRFLPAFFAMRGARIKQIPVQHRQRKAGQSKYTNLGRLRRTVWDLLAVRWMKSRCPRFRAEEIG
jgi:dolichol-phosphate mannosyltransferase